MKLPFVSNSANYFPELRPGGEQAPVRTRPFRVVQIEITSRCSTGCVFCPHDALSDRWLEGDISLNFYRKYILPHLDLFELVYLQGWGEPMLHPDLWEMFAMAKEKGCHTGFTTNGAWLEEDQNQRLLDMGVDMISVSFAGKDAPVHESLRINSRFMELCRNFENLASLKKGRGCDRPWLELHFLMTRANMGEFPSLVELAASLGADEVVATNLTYSPSLALDRNHVFGEGPLPEDLEVTNQARHIAERLDIPLRIYPLKTEPNTLVCDADPINTVYINHCGEVAPCVYLGLTVKGQIPRFYQGKLYAFDPISFGNISTGLDRVLKGKEREEFISTFQRRNVGKNPLAMFAYISSQDCDPELPPPPAPCQHCYKMLGV